MFQLDVPGQNIAGMVLKPWDQRTRTSNQLQPLIQTAARRHRRPAGRRVPAAAAAGQHRIAGAVRHQHHPTVRRTERRRAAVPARRALKSGLFIFLNTDLKIDQPQATVDIDRDKARSSGLKMSDIGGALASMLGGGYVNYFSLDGRSYKVIPQVQQRFRLNTDQLMNYYIRTATARRCRCRRSRTIKTTTVPESLNHFQQLNTAMIQGVPAPGVALANARSPT